MRISSRVACLVAALAWGVLAASPAAAQYFGRNKVQYDDFDFKILKSQHFDVYFYPEERVAVQDAGRMADRWYQRHSRTFLREFRERKPIIFYANDADFQQTNVVRGQIGQGTGGVTEALKERVVMPLTGSYSETSHVLGHELVHSFQYDIALNRQDSTRFAIGQLPLWFVEGMAEYLSVGREDPHTAMWLRDAALREDLPTIEDLRSPQYFPYRFGQAYMAYIGGKYGDASLANLWKLSGRTGVDSAVVYALGIRPDSLSNEWIQAIQDTYLPLMEGRTPPGEVGRPVLSKELEGGRINIAPALSPDGRYVAFLSERDLFNINLYVANAKTGEVIKELPGPAASRHFDALRFISSAGTWSPDGERLAFIAFAEGDNELAIWNVESGEIERRFSVKGVTAMTNPTWSPDGETIAFSGLDGGISDLYLLDLDSKNVRQLTDDRYADLQPTWSPDGERLAFVTDRGPNGTDFETLDFAQERLGLIDVESSAIEVLRPFGDALHHNPQFAPDGQSLFFISTHDGFKDVYRYALDTGQTFRVTRLKTGVSGITALSPAMSVARETGQMMFSVFSDNSYAIHALSADQTQGEPAEPLQENTTATAGLLPPVRSAGEGLVASYLDDPRTGLPETPTYEVNDYSARLALDRVAPPSVGVSVGGAYGTGVAGGVGFLFSDMLGNHNLQAVVQANGRIKDIGGQAAYTNLGNRFNYGASAAHIPIRDVLRFRRVGIDTYQRVLRRIYYDNASLRAAYPLSTTRRLELSGGFVRLGFDHEVEFFDRFGGRDVRDAEDVFENFEEPASRYYFTASSAYVGDYSFFGFTSPIQGGRHRFEVAPFVGFVGDTEQRFVQGRADYRRYFFLNPVTVAVRGLHVGNYGAKAQDDNNLTGGGRFGSFATLFMDSPYYGEAFVRGYNINSFENSECFPGGSAIGGETTGCPAAERLRGTRLALASAEVRVPLFGTPRLGLITFPYLPTEIAFFADAGVAWTADDPPVLKFERNTNERVPVTSTGVSARVNLLGYIVLESYYAYPFQRPNHGWEFGLTLRPGW